MFPKLQCYSQTELLKLQELKLTAAAGKLWQMIFNTPNSNCVCLYYLYLEQAYTLYTCNWRQQKDKWWVYSHTMRHSRPEQHTEWRKSDSLQALRLGMQNFTKYTFCPSLFESFQSNLVRHLHFASIDQVDASQNSEGLSHQDMKQ